MATQYKVQVGDTTSEIAKRFGVPTTAVSGYRSKNPNVIFPDEVLNIDEGQAINIPAGEQMADPVQEGPEITGNALLPSRSPVSPIPTVAPEIQSPIPTEEPIIPTEEPTAGIITPEQERQSQLSAINSLADQGVTDPEDIASALNEAGRDSGIESGFTAEEVMALMTGRELPEEEPVFGQYGFSGDAINQGFLTNPFGTISEIMNQVMQYLQLPETGADLASVADQIVSLENEGDSKIKEVEDNPFLSAGSKNQKIRLLQEEYTKKTDSLIRKLTLLQGEAQDARKQAQFVATTAINLYGKGLGLQQDELERMTDAEQKRLEAEAATGPITEETSKSGTIVGRDGTGKVVYTIKPDEGDGTDSFDTTTTTGKLGNIAQNLMSKFGSKFQQDSFRNNVDRLSLAGDEKQLADYIFSEAISQIADSETRKKAFSGYKISKKLDVLATQLAIYQAKGGDTSLFRGNIEDIKAKFGRVGDYDLRVLGTAMADTLDALARDRTGAVISESEEKFYDRLLPSTRKTAELNNAVINGLKLSLVTDLNSVLRFQLSGAGFDTIEPYLGGENFNLPDKDLAEEEADLEFLADDPASPFKIFLTDTLKQGFTNFFR